MLNVSNAFNEACAGEREIKARATFNGSASCVLDRAEISSVNIKELVNSDNGLTMGATCSAKLTMQIKTDKAIAYTNGYVFVEAAVNDEYIPLGKFYITEAPGVKTRTITAYDGMSQLEADYLGAINNSTIQSVAEGIATQCGITLASGIVWPNYSITTDKVYKCRELIGYIAGLMGKNARFDRDGSLNFVWYTDSGKTIEPGVIYSNGLERTTNESLTMNSITSGTEDNPLTVGSGRGITFENPFMTQEILNAIWAATGSITYTPCEVKWRGNPALQAGDIVTVNDVDSSSYCVLIMCNEISIRGGMSAKTYCYGQEEADYVMSESPTDRKIKKTYTDLTAAFQDATEKIIGAKGGYFQILKDANGFPTGWRIMDTPTVTVTTKMWIFNSEGLGFSADGGATISKIALTKDGTANADIINGGELHITDNIYIMRGNSAVSAIQWADNAESAHSGTPTIISVSTPDPDSLLNMMRICAGPRTSDNEQAGISISNLRVNAGPTFAINGYDVTDFVVEQGTDGIWTYRKWNSGVAECWGMKAYSNVAYSGTYGSMYYASVDKIAYPFTFIDYPNVFLSVQSEYGRASSVVMSSSDNQKYETGTIAVYSPGSTAASTWVSIKAVGRWK